MIRISFRKPVSTRWPWFNWPAWARWLTTLSFLTLVNCLLLAPAAVFQGVDVFVAYQDKIAHGLIFLTLALLVRWSLPGECGRGRLQPAAISVLVLYTGSIEIFQPMFGGPGRTFEWLDLAGNFAGLCIGWLLFGRAIGRG